MTLYPAIIKALGWTYIEWIGFVRRCEEISIVVLNHACVSGWIRHCMARLMDLHAFYSFYVDTTPIRVFKNNKDIGVAYPDSQPVGVYSTIWNGENWATNDGWVKLNWTMAPFVATYEGFNVDACLALNGNTAPCIAETNSWWEQSAYQTLGVKEVNQLAWIRKNYLLYDYCADRKRFPTAAPECARNPL